MRSITAISIWMVVFVIQAHTDQLKIMSSIITNIEFALKALIIHQAFFFLFTLSSFVSTENENEYNNLIQLHITIMN